MRHFMVMTRYSLRVCRQVDDADTFKHRWSNHVRCGAGWQECQDDKPGHDTRTLEVWEPHCPSRHGMVAALYNTIGKARSAAKLKSGDKDVLEARVHYFDTEDTFWVDDPTPKSQIREARMLREAEQAQVEEQNEREALVAPPKKVRKKKVAPASTPETTPWFERTVCEHGAFEPWNCLQCRLLTEDRRHG